MTNSLTSNMPCSQPANNDSMITREEFHLRINQTNAVIEDFRNLKVQLAEKVVKDQLERDQIKRDLADHKLKVKTELLEHAATITSELREYKLEVHESFKCNTDAIKEIHTLLHNVSANGTRGLENSLRDIYSKINDLFELTKQMREDRDFKKSFSKWKNATVVRRVFFTKKSYVTIIALFFAAHKIQIAGNSILQIIIDFLIN